MDNKNQFLVKFYTISLLKQLSILEIKNWGTHRLFRLSSDFLTHGHF